MEALLAELEPEFGEGKIFRPYRDVRFSKDKTPYKTAIGATLSRGGYVQLSVSGLGAGAGMYQMGRTSSPASGRASSTTPRGRRSSAWWPPLVRRAWMCQPTKVLKTAPKGYPKDHPRIDLLRQKGVITWRQWPAGAWLGTARAKSRIVDFLHASQPIKDWLDANVGPSTEGEGRA